MRMMSDFMSAPASVFQGLIYNLFQQPRVDADRGLVLCFTSAQPGEGVTHVVRALANEVGAQSPERVARVDLGYLQTHALPPPDIAPRMMMAAPKNEGAPEAKSDVKDEQIASPVKSDLPGKWHGSRQYRRDYIEELRKHFDYVLIDCPSLGASGDVFSVAPLVDGVLLVVEANRTKASQVLHAERKIQAAGGVFRGHILNKRKYFVPQWLYKRLSAN